MASELEVLLRKPSPKIGEILTALILGLKQPRTPEEKVAWIGATGEMLQPLGLSLFVNAIQASAGEPSIWLAFPDEHPALMRLFMGTPWADGDWGSALRQAPGAEVHSVEINGQPCVCTMFPLSALESEFGMGAKKN